MARRILPIEKVAKIKTADLPIEHHKGEPKETKASKVFKYQCPVCGLKIRTSKEAAHIQCMDCDKELQVY